MPTNASDVYFGSYIRFQTPDKQTGAVIAGSDYAVGDCGEVVWQLDENKHQQAWLKNPYGQTFAYLSPSDSYKLAIYHAKGWVIRYVLSFTAYSEEPDPGVYWGQVAIFAYAPRYADEFERFVKTFALAAADGSRPDPSLSPSGVATVLADPESWTPSNKVKIPKGNGRTAILKDHRSIHDKMLDKGRSGNVGCYIISWAFIFAVIALVVWILHSMGII